MSEIVTVVHFFMFMLKSELRPLFTLILKTWKHDDILCLNWYKSNIFAKKINIAKHIKYMSVILMVICNWLGYTSYSVFHSDSFFYGTMLYFTLFTLCCILLLSTLWLPIVGWIKDFLILILKDIRSEKNPKDYFFTLPY